MSNHNHTGGGAEFSARQATRFFLRAARLRCPLCGQSPVFPPARRTRSFYDWFQPLDGCPRCGYAYEREPGYFLLATWGGIYGFGSLFGMVLFLVLEALHPMGLVQTIALVGGASMLLCFLIARHVKAFFIAFDRFWDQDRGS